MLPFLNESSGGFPYPLGPPYNISPTTGAPSRADCLTHGFAEYYFSSAVSVAFQVSGATPVLFNLSPLSLCLSCRCSSFPSRKAYLRVRQYISMSWSVRVIYPSRLRVLALPYSVFAWKAVYFYESVGLPRYLPFQALSPEAVARQL